MFQPIHMGTNHMLGVDAAVPLTTNNFEIRVYGEKKNPMNYVKKP